MQITKLKQISKFGVKPMGKTMAQAWITLHHVYCRVPLGMGFGRFEPIS